MKPLFENKTTLSKNIYIELLTFQQRKFGWKYTVYTAIFFLLFILLISFLFANHYFAHGFIIFILFSCFLAYQFIHPTHKNTKEFHSDKVQNNLVNTYSFYERNFTFPSFFFCSYSSSSLSMNSCNSLLNFMITSFIF